MIYDREYQYWICLLVLLYIYCNSASSMLNFLLLCHTSSPQTMPYLHLLLRITRDWLYIESTETIPLRQSIMRQSHLPSIHRSLSLPKRGVIVVIIIEKSCFPHECTLTHMHTHAYIYRVC